MTHRLENDVQFASDSFDSDELWLIRLIDICSLKALDLLTLRELSKRVNVIPVIAKSDTTCKNELVRFKSKVGRIYN